MAWNLREWLRNRSARRPTRSPLWRRHRLPLWLERLEDRTCPSNTPPTLSPIGSRTVDEGMVLSFQATATDTDMPPQMLSYSLVGTVPPGASVDPTGMFNWTPTEAQGDGDYLITLRVTDNGSPQMYDEETFTVTVNEVNQPPTLPAPPAQTVNEGQTVSVQLQATDPDLPSQSLTYSLTGEVPAGASIDAQTGLFTWVTTEVAGPGSYSINVEVSDNFAPTPGPATTMFMVTVNEVNQAPVLAAIGDRSVNEGATLTFTASAADADLPAQSLMFSLEGMVPSGASIDSMTGAFSWTPTEAQGPGTYTFTVRVSDNAMPAPLSDTETITVTVNEVNQAPVLSPIGNFTVDEGMVVSFTATATDADQPMNVLTYSLVGGPAGASINPTSGAFNWTPTEAQGAGVYSFSVQVSDGSATASQPVTVTVNEVNQAPTLQPISSQTVNEGQALSVQAQASDPDLPAQGLTYSLTGVVPTGASINATTGLFTWTPTEAQGPGSYSITVQVSDNHSPTPGTASVMFTVTVNEVNQAPILAAIGDRSVNEGATLTFTASATDADLPAQSLMFSLEGTVPTGASIDSTTGAFSWTPTEAQGPGSYTFTVRVSDNTAPTPLSDSETITVTVAEVNQAPTLSPIGNFTVDEGMAVSFTATATDADQPAQALTYSLVGGPAGASINATSGAFSWTPTEAQGAGTYSFSVQVSDGSATASQPVTVTVNEVNQAPTLQPISSQTVDEGQALSVQAQASDADLPAQGLTYSLTGTVPAGASINATTGLFTWTPTEAQGPGSYTITVQVSDNHSPTPGTTTTTFTVTVNEVNQAPVLAAIGDRSVNEGATLTFTASATDADLPAQSLTFSLEGTVPAGASINPTTGAFSWTPTEAQGPGTFTFTVRVSDGAMPTPLSDTETITVTVAEVNQAPVLSPIGNRTVDEGQTLTFTASATDADQPAQSLTYSLVGAPAGASINPTTGAFSWAPTEGQDGAHEITVRVSDGGNPALSDEETITVTVAEVNQAPVLGPVGDKSVDEGEALTFTATATDGDLPAQSLTFSLTGAPTGASINATTGAFTWTPTTEQGPGTYTFTVRVGDSGNPALYDEETITVTVTEDADNRAPVLSSIGDQSVDEGQALTFTASATDADYPAQTLTYSLVGAPSGASINSTTGSFSWTPTEAQGPGTFTFTVRVTDNGSPALSDEEEITVTVNEVNSPPVANDATFQVAENSANGTAVGTASASDPDQPAQALSYSITSGNTGGAFAIDAGTGQITVANGAQLNYEAAPQFSLTVQVSDGLLTAFATMVINLVNVNEAPEFNSAEEPDLYEFYVPENSANGTAVGTAGATDPDNNPLTYSIIDGNDGNAFAINPSTGAITVADGTKLDYEDVNNWKYILTVQVSDGALTDTATVVVRTTDVNEAPDFKPADDTYTVTLARSHKSGNEIEDVNGNIVSQATDPEGDTLTYSITAGATDLFQIDANTGKLTLKVNAITLPAVFYTLTIQVSDGTLTDTATVNITVKNAVGVAGDTHAVEGSTDDITVRFIRYSKDPNAGPLTATYTITWAPNPDATALPADLEDSADKTAFLTGTVTFAPGETQKTFTLSALADGNPGGSVEGTQTFWVTVTANPDDNYIPVAESAAVPDKKKENIDSFGVLDFHILDGVTLFAKQNTAGAAVDDVDASGMLDAADLAHANPGIHVNDVDQGSLGDCYLMAGIAALAIENWGQIQSRFIPDGDGYKVRLWNGSAWVDIPVSMDLQRGSDMAELSGDVDAQGRAEVWTILLEQAYATLKGGYGTIGDGGFSGDVYTALTGTQTNAPVSTAGKTDLEIWNAINNVRGQGKQVVLNTKTTQPAGSNLAGNHAYVVTGVHAEPGNDYFTLYNPWGASYETKIYLDDLNDYISSYQVLENVP